MRILNSIIILITGLLLHGQPGYVNKLYDIDKGGNYSDEIIRTDSGYVLTGSSLKNGFGSTLVLGLGNAFEKNWLWERTFESGTTSYHGFSDELVLTLDGNILLSGRKSIFIDSLNGRMSKHLFLRKFNLNGDSIWFGKYPTNDGNHYPSGLEQLPDGSIYTGGFVTDSIGGLADIYLMKVDENGKFLWKKRYPVNDDQELFFIESDNNGNLYLSGEEIYQGKSHGYIMKVDSSGNELWHKRYAGKYGAQRLRITGLKSGNVVGAFWRYDDVYQPNSDIYLGPAVVIKWDTAGNEVWKKEYGKERSMNVFTEIAEYENGDLALAGLQDNILGYRDGWIMKLNSEGDSIWSRNYKHDNYRKGLENNHYLLSVLAAEDGGVIAGGHVIPDYGMYPDATQDIWLVKTDSNGCLFAGCDTACSPVPEVSYEYERINNYKYRFINTSEQTLNTFMYIHNEFRDWNDPGYKEKYVFSDTLVINFGREGTAYIEIKVETECLDELYLLDSFPVTKPSGMDRLSRDGLSLYPNPVHENLHISLPGEVGSKLHYVITSTTGRQMLKGRLNESRSISTANLSSGLYVLRLYDGNGVLKVRERFVKE